MADPNARLGGQWGLVFGAWLIALASTLGALFLGEVMGLVPCVLCWYQRIAMFPMVIILGAGLLRSDPGCVRYALPLAIAGGAIALYHCLLYWGIIPAGLVPCGEGPSCTEIKLELVGFITIPLLSLTAFCAITTLLWIVKKRVSS
jgi:disulfide bond formation protein DsbB